MLKLLEGGRQAIQMFYGIHDWVKLLHCPPIDVALNIVDFGLYLVHAKVGRQGWGAQHAGAGG